MSYFQAFGLSCLDGGQDGGQFYVCKDAQVAFVGCCTTDPCADGSGKCPKANMRASSFSGGAYLSIPAQDCDAPKGSDNWYTCAGTKPPFIGCCSVNPCKEGECPREKLLPAKLSEVDKNRNAFLAPSGATSASTSPKSTSTSPTSSTAPAVPLTAGSQQSSPSGLSTGAIVGISVSIGSLALVLVAFLMYKFGWSVAKRRERKKGPRLPPPMAQSEYDNGEPSPYYDHKAGSQASQYRGLWNRISTKPHRNEKDTGTGDQALYRDIMMLKTAAKPLDSCMSGSTAISSSTNTMFSKQQHMYGLPPDTSFGTMAPGDLDPRHRSPAYSPGHSRNPSSSGAAAGLPVVYEMDSTPMPQELASDQNQSVPLYHPYRPLGSPQPPNFIHHQQQQRGRGHSRGPSLDTQLSSPGNFRPESPIVSDLEGGSHYGSSVGSLRQRSPEPPRNGAYTSLPLGGNVGGD